MRTNFLRFSQIVAIIFYFTFSIYAQDAAVSDPAAEEIIKKAVAKLGGERYLNVKSQITRGKFSVIKSGTVSSFQSFIDVMVYPDKERTDFKGGGSKTVQVNTGQNGWVFDGDMEMIKDQTDVQVANFKRGIRTSLDNLLRGHWRGQAIVRYAGKRQASLGKRNDVIELIYNDGFKVEFEFAADDATPAKAIYSRINLADEEVKEEDRYAQFIMTGGIATPYIIDRTTNGQPSSRINVESVEFNKNIPNEIFEKPSNIKAFKKDLKL